MSQQTASKYQEYVPERWIAWLAGLLALLLFAGIALLLLAPRSLLAEITFLSRIDAGWLPHLNATLNGASAVALSAGYLFIRQGKVWRHRFCMQAAFGISALFLLSYVVYHAAVGSTRFDGLSWLRPIYYVILTSHILLAALVPPLAVVTLFRARRNRFSQHRAIARWTLPAWLYVSASGVTIYLMLYLLG